MNDEPMNDEVMQTITGRTELLGLLAHPIRHSQSPRMHNLAIARLGLDYAYLAFEVDDEELPAAVEAMRTLKVRGWNVSMPNKMRILTCVDTITPAAELIGASNTVVNEDGRLTAYNTDGVGAMEALRFFDHAPEGRTITIIGAGGAGTAGIPSGTTPSARWRRSARAPARPPCCTTSRTRTPWRGRWPSPRC